jgi:hypothetical protein
MTSAARHSFIRSAKRFVDTDHPFHCPPDCAANARLASSALRRHPRAHTNFSAFFYSFVPSSIAQSIENLLHNCCIHTVKAIQQLGTALSRDNPSNYGNLIAPINTILALL